MRTKTMSWCHREFRAIGAVTVARRLRLTRLNTGTAKNAEVVLFSLLGPLVLYRYRADSLWLGRRELHYYYLTEDIS
jgi:hypothetical protein